MNRLQERSRAGDPFGDSVAPLVVMRLLEVAVEPVIVDRCARDLVRPTRRNRVIPIDDVFGIRRLQS